MFGFIYVTTNLINGKVYVGQKKLSNYNRNYLGSGKIIQLAIKKYGINNFEFKIIEWCDDKTTLDVAEKYHIYAYQTQYGKRMCYNISMGGSGEPRFGQDNPWYQKGHLHPTFGKKRSSEIGEKIRRSKLGKSRPDMCKGGKNEHAWKKAQALAVIANRGKTHSEETRAKISAALTGRKNGPCSLETRAKISAAHRRRRLQRMGHDPVAHSST